LISPNQCFNYPGSRPITSFAAFSFASSTKRQIIQFAVLHPQAFKAEFAPIVLPAGTV